MFIVKVDGEPTALTNTFESAVAYVDGIRQPGRTVTIAVSLSRDLRPVLHTLERREAIGRLDPKRPPAQIQDRYSVAQ